MIIKLLGCSLSLKTSIGLMVVSWVFLGAILWDAGHRSRRDQSTGPSEQPPPEKLPDNHPSKSKHLHCMVTVVSSPTSTMVSLGGAASLLGKGWRKRIFTSLVLNRKKREEMRGAGLFKTPPGTNFGWWWCAPQIHIFSSFSMYH